MRRWKIVGLGLVIAVCTVSCSSTLYDVEVGDVFGTGTSTLTAEENGTDVQSNKESFRLDDMNVKEVTVDVAESIPEYDFSGPANLGMDSSNKGTSVTTVSDQPATNLNGGLVYLAVHNSTTAVKRYEPKDSDSQAKVVALIAKAFSKNADDVEKNINTWGDKIYAALNDGSTGGDYDKLFELFYPGNSAKNAAYLTLASVAGETITISGKSYSDTLLELSVAKKVESALVAKGYKVMLSQPLSGSANTDANTGKKKAQQAKKNNAAAIVDINVGTGESEIGAQVKMRASSVTTATAFAETLAANLKNAGWSMRGTPTAVDTGGASGFNCSSLLGWAECLALEADLGYFGDKSDYEMLLTGDGLNKTAQAIADGIAAHVQAE